MKVVVAVDGSKYGRWAIEWAGRFPLLKQESVTALHVIDLGALAAPLVPHPAPVWDAPYIKKETARLEGLAHSVVKETKRQLAAAKLKGRVLVEHGSTASRILDHAKNATTLIVLGSRGLDALDRFMLGSVSTKVIHHAKGPVLVVKEPARLIRRVLYAADGSGASVKALRFLEHHLAATVPERDPIEVAVVYAMPLLRYPELRAVGHELVDAAASRLERAGFVTERVFKIGHPADEVLQYARRHKSDLIVCGARGRGALARFLLGSVSTNIVQHSSCSVLVVR